MTASTLQKYSRKLKEIAIRTPFWVSLFTLLILIYDLGFTTLNPYQETLNKLYITCLWIGMFAIVRRYFSKGVYLSLAVKVFDAFSIVLFLTLLITRLAPNHAVLLFDRKAMVFFAVFIMLIREFSVLQFNLKKTKMNPAQLFVSSFLLVILVGALLLSFPKATYAPISYIDALFTATSAVCVTGLSVVDVGGQFTKFGQTIMMFLMEFGGLGVMTIASYFSYFFRGKSSYGNQLALKDMSYVDKLGDVFATLKRVIIISSVIQILGMILIFIYVRNQEFDSIYEHIYFSVFHAISAFCNAGFSTLPDGLYTFEYRFNYPLHLVISGLFIIGGLGFPIVFNVYKYIQNLIFNRLLPFSFNQKSVYKPWVVNLSTRIILITTAVLIVGGTFMIYAMEYNNTLSEHGFIGKWVEAFFTATAPRTAGFATVDNSLLRLPSMLLIILLMWIGASPISTGGGIKTSTFAIAVLNIVALTKNRSRIEVYRREIEFITVKRAFAIIVLSLLAVGCGIFSMTFFDPEFGLISIAYECFSAYSTTGLSLGITQRLGDASKLTLILLMFIGRVSLLTMLLAIVRKEKYKNYNYPPEEIIIN